MALLKCRNCDEEISSDARVTRCKGCGTLFPLACAVCERNLRPPFPVYSDERYLDGADNPLCPDHFERQCPSCKTWFQADENPGYFMCRTCLEVRESAALAATTEVATDYGVPEQDEVVDFPQWRDEPAAVGVVGASRDFISMLLLVIVGISMLVVMGVLAWQVVTLLRVFKVL